MIPGSVLEAVYGSTVHCEVECQIGLEGHDGYKVHSHKTMKPFEWDESRVSLHAPAIDNTGRNNCHGLLQEFEGKPLLNARVLQFLMYSWNRDRIPIAWDNLHVVFAGTIYRDPGGLLCVRVMFRSSRGNHLWDWDYAYVDDIYLPDHMIAVLAG
ncbi:MAG TPA: hypothetical protein VHU23_01665 [Rhizomicrobium sp.]|jgi:hypothetical protein|nr:hypothetical protein [Rhizomicrobium sp.]